MNEVHQRENVPEEFRLTVEDLWRRQTTRYPKMRFYHEDQITKMDPDRRCLREAPRQERLGRRTVFLPAATADLADFYRHYEVARPQIRLPNFPVDDNNEPELIEESGNREG